MLFLARQTLYFGLAISLSLVLPACSVLSFKRTSAQSATQLSVQPPLAPVSRANAPLSSPNFTRPPTEVKATPVGFSELPGWSADQVQRALPAFRKSCKNLEAKHDAAFIGKTELGGRAEDWKGICRSLRSAPPRTPEEARNFFLTHFQPHVISGSGVFTGYYEPLLVGSLTRKPGFEYPLYLKPDEAKSWMSNKGTGPSRQALETTYLATLKPLLWLQDPVEVFMLQVQGSGLVQLDTGKRVRVSYSGDNGIGYKSIYPAMAELGFGKKTGKSLQSMTAWLQENSDVAREIMWTNPRFIFFRAHSSDGPVGAEGVTLTAGRSMAVDPSHIPLGVPLWLDTKAYYRGKMLPVQRLMVAQDVGSAIKGVVRGDVFWGTGPKALEVAGNMKEPGRYFILLPKGSSSFASR